MKPAYIKEMPGAEMTFRPGNLAEYADEAWDVRISMGHAPLDEAFFYSLDSLADAEQSIRSLLDETVLNPAREEGLDLMRYPELPFLREELRQMWLGAAAETLTLKISVNGCAEPVDWDAPAKDFLSTCVFRDHSWDYVVLDLVFDAQEPVGDEAQRDAFVARHRELDAKRIQAECKALQRYEKYASVAVAPCALGVPDGFDVRLQMMELDGLDPERCAYVQVMAAEALEPAAAFERVCTALAFQTHFSVEVLDGLKVCGALFEDA